MAKSFQHVSFLVLKDECFVQNGTWDNRLAFEDDKVTLTLVVVRQFITVSLFLNFLAVYKNYGPTITA